MLPFHTENVCSILFMNGDSQLSLHYGEGDLDSAMHFYDTFIIPFEEEVTLRTA